MNFWQRNNKISHHPSNVSLHYRLYHVKCLWSKIGMFQSWVKRTVMQNLAILNSCWKYSSNDVSTISLTEETTLQGSHRKPQRITSCTQLQQSRRKTSQHCACAHDKRSDSHWRAVTSGLENTSLIIIRRIHTFLYRHKVVTSDAVDTYTMRYDTVDLRALKSWRDGQLNLAHGPETKK